jgi:homoserine dehydrogenase
LILRTLLIGFGKIGKNLVEILLEKGSYLEKRYGVKLEIVGVLDRSGAAVSQDRLDLQKLLDIKNRTGKIANYPLFGEENISLTEVLDRTDADLLVELTPTNIQTGQPGISNMLHAMSRRMDIVTTNKGALATGYKLLTDKALQMNVALKFGGAAHMSIPCIDVDLYQNLGLRIIGIEAIVNATTNYVLTQMSEGASIEAAIRTAQAEGIAEHDPSLDLEGWDTACKMVILANWLFKTASTLSDVEIKGITEVTTKSIREAKREGYAIRPIGEIGNDKNRIILKSYPKMVPLTEPLATVEGFHKAITFHINQGDILIKTELAGPKPSAYAILEDIIGIRMEKNLLAHAYSS